MKQVTQDALSAYLKSVQGNINTSSIDEILNLPAQYRWYASNELLNSHEIQVARNAGVRVNKPKTFIELYAGLAKDAVKSIAYKEADFGRYQSTHSGQNTLPSLVNVRHVLDERYSRKYRSSDLYSDFFFAASDTDAFSFLVKTNATEKLHKVYFFDLPICKYINGLQYNFIFNHPLFSKCNFEFDKKEISVNYNGHIYHIEDRQVFAPVTDNAYLLKKIIIAFQNRKRIQKKDAVFNSLDMDNIFVTIQDSVNAGNCEKGTKDFATRYFPEEIKNNNPISAQMIWDKLKNEYTKRAILSAAKRPGV